MCLLIPFLLLPIMTCLGVEFEDTPQLVVKGEASIFKPADQMEATVGVVTSDENSTLALNQNNQYIHQIIANLKAIGLEDAEFQTGRFHIRPIYEKSLKDESEEKIKIARYEVINSIQIKTQQIALADTILRSAVQGGANQVDSVLFSLKNPQSYREEVIKLATQNALLDASALSNAAGVRLKRILRITLDHWQQSPHPMLLSKRGNTSGSSSEKLPEQEMFEPGQSEIHAVVNVTFEIDY